MSVRVELKGFDEMIRQLTNAPQFIRERGLQIVKEETDAAATEIALHYPSRSGTLARRVRSEFPSSQLLIGLVRSLAPHSHLFEFGTKDRKTSAGANRGRMPDASPAIFVPAARRHRERMFHRLAEMLRQMGFQVPV